MERKSFIGGCATAAAVLAATALLLRGCQKDLPPTSQEVTIETVTDTVEVLVRTPVPVDSIVHRYVTVRVPIADTVQIAAASQTQTPHADSVNVSLPLTQRVYSDSTYQAWVSGYMPALDSIRILQPVTTVTRTVTNTETRYRTRRWGLGIHAGVGLTPNKPQPYIGIGIQYNILSW